MTTKRAPKPLSKIEKFYIENTCSDKTVEDLCKEISKSKQLVQDYYQECLTKKQTESKMTADKLMNVNSKQGYAIMSKEASEFGEQNRTAREVKTPSHIHKIKPDK